MSSTNTVTSREGRSTWSPDKIAWIVLGVTLAARLLWLIASPLELSADESYYWDWGRRLDWGYYSKPPLIGWIYGLTGLWHATTAAGARAPAVVFGMVTMFAVWRLGRALGGSRVGLFALLIAASMPGNLGLGYFLTPDTLLLAAWSLASWSVWMIIGESTRSKSSADSKPVWRWWLLYTLATVFGALAKQMMLVLPALAAIYIFTTPSCRECRRRAMFWVGLLMPFLALVPTLIWNQRHHWITAKHTAHHFSAEPWRIGGALKDMAGFMAGQASVAGPLAFVLLIVSAFAWKESRADRGRWYAWVLSIPPLAVIAVLSMRQEVNPNWPAAFYLGGTLLVAMWLAASEQRAKRWFKPTVITGVSLMTLTCLACALLGPLGLYGTKADFTSRLRGWSEFAKLVDKQRMNQPTAPIVVVDMSRKYASALAFYLPDQPRIYSWKRVPTTVSQYDIWPGPFEELPAGTTMLLVTQAGTEPPPTMKERFARISPVGDVSALIGKKRKIEASLWLGETSLAQ